MAAASTENTCLTRAASGVSTPCHVVIVNDVAVHTARDVCSCRPRPMLTTFRLSDPVQDEVEAHRRLHVVGRKLWPRSMVGAARVLRDRKLLSPAASGGRRDARHRAASRGGRLGNERPGAGEVRDLFRLPQRYGDALDHSRRHGGVVEQEQ